MKRTKLEDRQLPDYTRGEEIFNMVTHIVGASLGVVALVLCIIFSAIHHDAYAVIGSIVYGVSLIVLYTMSAIYHGLTLKHLRAKKVFQIMDHCSIFILIAGTYTPVLLCSIRRVDPTWAMILLIVVWLAAIIGITLNAIDIKRYKVFSMICYLAIGWCIVFKFSALYQSVGFMGVLLLVIGGLCYTVGTLFYKAQDNHKYMHSIWHLWIIAGSIFHFFCILLYVI